MKVTQYQRQVKTNAVSGHRLSLPEDTFGQSIAKGLGDVGTALGGVAKDLKQQADNTAFTSAQSALTQLEQNDFYGDNGYKSRQGQNAMGLSTQLKDDFDKNYQKIADGLANETQRRMFKDWAYNKYFPSLRSSAIEHEFAQLKSHQDAVDLANANTMMEAAVFSCYDTALFNENISQFDASIFQLAERRGLQGEARADFIKKNRSALSVAVVQKMLSDQPDNPWAAQKFFQQAVKDGRIDAKGYEEVKKVLKPAVENAQANALVKKISAEVVADDANDDPNQYGKPIAGFGKRAHAVLTDPNIPDHLKTKVIQGLAANEKAINASRAESYAQNYNKVLLQVQKGIPVSNAEGYELLRPEDRNKLSWRAAGHSDAQTWSRLKQLQINGRLTVADVNASVGMLSESDFRSFYGVATGSVVFGNGVTPSDEKFISQNLQLALANAGEESFKAGYKSKEPYARYHYYVSENVAAWRKNNPNERLTLEVLSDIAYRTKYESIADNNDWWVDDRYSYMDLRSENDKRRAQGQAPLEFPLSDVVLYDNEGNAIKESAKYVSSAVAVIKDAKLQKAQKEAQKRGEKVSENDIRVTAEDVVGFWVQLQLRPKAYDHFMMNNK